MLKEIKKEINKIIEREEFPQTSFEVSPSKFGDYSTNVALRLAGFKNYQKPIEIAKFFQAELKKNENFSEVEIAEPGFINIYMSRKKAVEILQNIIEQNESYGSTKTNQGKKAQIEFVSANPTGPLHVGNARGGPLGDSLARVLEKTGFEVTKQYYDNNIGTQIDIFGDSLIAILKKEEVGADTMYQGEYLDELAEKIRGELELTSSEVIDSKREEIKKLAVEKLFTSIIKDCQKMSIEFDTVYHEKDLQSDGLTDRALKFLKEKGLTKEKEGAVWFAPKDSFLEDRESVLIRSDGRFTYFADDIALHELKFSQKPDLVIDVLGSNHHGHVPRLEAAVNALGYDVNKFKVILYQYVRVKRGSDIVKMSKRAGNFVTAEEVLQEVGKDAFRFILLSHSPNSHLDFDLELAKKQSSENPVYYVQYAHARLCSILAKAPKSKTKPNLSLLKEESEMELIKKIMQLPDLLDQISESFAVQHLTTFALETADLFHSFYEKNRVIGEDPDLTVARLELVKATKITLANTLGLLGISAPERM